MNSLLPLSFGMSKHDLKTVEDSQMTAKTFREALALCIYLSKYRHNHKMLAADLYMCGSQLSKCLRGSFHFPGGLIPELERLCGNTAVTQWFVLQHGAAIKVKTPEEIIQEQAQEIAELRAKVAA